MFITSTQGSNTPIYRGGDVASNPPQSELYTKMTKIAKLSFCAIGLTIGGIISAVGMLAGLSVVGHLYFNTTIGLTIYQVVKPIFFSLGFLSGFFAVSFLISPSMRQTTEALSICSAASFIAPFLPLTIGTVAAAPGLFIMKYCGEKGISIYNDHID